MLNRNAAAPWLYAAGGVVLGLVGFKAVSGLKRRGRAQNMDLALEPQSERADSLHSGENAEPPARRAFVPELLDEELEAALAGRESAPGDAYDAVAPDDLAPEWLSRATETSVIASPGEPLDAEVAELLRDAGMSVISEGSLNSADPDQLEAAVGAELEGDDEKFDLEFDHSGSRTRE